MKRRTVLKMLPGALLAPSAVSAATPKGLRARLSTPRTPKRTMQMTTWLGPEALQAEIDSWFPWACESAVRHRPFSAIVPIVSDTSHIRYALRAEPKAMAACDICYVGSGFPRGYAVKLCRALTPHRVMPNGFINRDTLRADVEAYLSVGTYVPGVGHQTLFVQPPRVFSSSGFNAWADPEYFLYGMQGEEYKDYGDALSGRLDLNTMDYAVDVAEVVTK